MACVYVLKNKTNGHCYVWQTIQTFKRRWEHHLDHKDCNMVITRAIKKYGKDNFEKHVYYLPVNLLDYFEIELIKRLNTLAPNGYNLDSGGNKNKKQHPDTIKKLKESHIGFKPTEETKSKLRKAWQDPKYRKHMVEIHKGKSPVNKGKYKYPRIHKECPGCHKLFESNNGKREYKYCSKRCHGLCNSENNSSKRPEVRKKQSEKAKGRKLSKETKKKISEAQKGKIRVERITVLCIVCGKEIVKKITSPQKLCSFKCNRLHQILNKKAGQL